MQVGSNRWPTYNESRVQLQNRSLPAVGWHMQDSRLLYMQCMHEGRINYLDLVHKRLFQVLQRRLKNRGRLLFSDRQSLL